MVVEERQVAVELAVDHRGEGAELGEHGQERLEQPVGGVERVGQGHATHDRAGDVAFVPLVAGELADHRQVAAQDHGEPVDALARPGVHLVRHRARADLAGLEALGHELDAGHQPDGGGEVARAGGGLHERRDDVEVERARVDLADAGEDVLEAEVAGDALLEIGQLGRVAVEQVELVLGSADRSLDAAQRVARDQVVGAAQDQLDLLEGDPVLVDLEEGVARHLGFERVLTSVGQVYPRSLDLDVVAALVRRRGPRTWPRPSG